MQMFLGMVNFYRHFLPGAARALKPLTDCLRGGPKGPTAVEWNGEREAAFTEVKQMLASASRLAHPAKVAKLSLAVDTSATHIGACLQQKRAGSPSWEPLGSFSKKLELAQVKYSEEPPYSVLERGEKVFGCRWETERRQCLWDRLKPRSQCSR